MKALWWLYFSESEHQALAGIKTAFIWGYGHLLVFASVAAVGAGLALNVDVLSGQAHIEGAVSDAALTIPVALYLLGLWVVHDQFNHEKGLLRYLVLATALLILGATFVPFAPASTALLLTACLVVRIRYASFAAS
ncbi:MAG: low temperature requirement protein A [Bacteroidetes bacterium]|nr:low temperature requirement protein A [Bacteroidota bacterium]